MKIYKNLTELIGKTPLMELGKYSKEKKIEGKLIGKLEYFNPGGSIKDRIALAMIEAGEKEGKINKDTLLIEPTSGNTGVGLAWVSRVKGLKLILTMPDSMSIERRNLLKALGAELVLTQGKKGMKGAIEKAEELSKKNPNSFIPSQFENPSNPEIHRLTTAEEIWEDTKGKIDIFVAGIGTGGTITGTGEKLKEKNPKIKIVGVEPKNSNVLSGGKPGPHKIQGIGAGFIPEVLNTKIIDEIIQVENEDSFKTTKELAKHEGLLVGISSGAAVYAAAEIGKRPQNKNKNIVVLLPDTGERYLSTDIFD